MPARPRTPACDDPRARYDSPSYLPPPLRECPGKVGGGLGGLAETRRRSGGRRTARFGKLHCRNNSSFSPRMRGEGGAQRRMRGFAAVGAKRSPVRSPDRLYAAKPLIRPQGTFSPPSRGEGKMSAAQGSLSIPIVRSPATGRRFQPQVPGVATDFPRTLLPPPGRLRPLVAGEGMNSSHADGWCVPSVVATSAGFPDDR